MVLRFIAGLALGSIMPNAISLVGEYSPRSIRVPMMIVVGTGFTAGAAIGGFVAFWLIPNFGWRSVFAGRRRDTTVYWRFDVLFVAGIDAVFGAS